MTGEVTIYVEGRQRAGGEELSSSTRAKGLCRFREGGYDLTYEELTEAGKVRTRIRLEKRSLRVSRSGAAGLDLDLIPGETRETAYETAFGAIPLSVQTGEVEIRFTRELLSARASYVLFSGGGIVSENEINIKAAATLR